MQRSESTLNDSNEVKSITEASHKQSRAPRWLKKQDRELMVVFYKLARIHKSVKTHEFWVVLKTELKTERPVKFLRRRYRKLLRNQTLNKHEKMYFNEYHHKFTPEQLMIVFPGKSKATILKLYEEVETQKSRQVQTDTLVKQKPSR